MRERMHLRPDAVVLLVTPGLSDFLENSLRSLALASSHDATIYVYHTSGASSEVEKLREDLDFEAVCFDGQAGLEVTEYQVYGSPSFGQITLRKFQAIAEVMAVHERVLFSDVDVAWARDPWPYLTAVLDEFDIAIQTEPVDHFPPAYCTGIIAIRTSEWTRVFIDELTRETRNSLEKDASKNDQVAFNEYLHRNRQYIKRIYPLPEGLFCAGLLAVLFQHGDKAKEVLEHRISPIAFHANWTKGIDNKRRLLKAAGLWIHDVS